MKRTINLETKLMQSNSQNQDLLMQERIIREHNNLLTHADQEDIQVLKKAGFEHGISQGEKTLSERSSTTLDHKRVFSRKQILDLCHRYELKFLPTEYYRGHIDPQAGVKIREFERQFTPAKAKMKYTSNKWVFDGNEGSYFICAPAECFSLNDSPEDPLLFAAMDTAGDDWYLVHKWGADLSVSRRIKVILKTPAIYRFLVILAGLLTVVLPMVFKAGALTMLGIVPFAVVAAGVLVLLSERVLGPPFNPMTPVKF